MVKLGVVHGVFSAAAHTGQSKEGFLASLRKLIEWKDDGASRSIHNALNLQAPINNATNKTTNIHLSTGSPPQSQQ